MLTRDSQRTKFNIWNATYCNSQYINLRTILFAEVESTINTALISYGCPVPKYKYKLKRSNDYMINQLYEITLPRFASDYPISNVCRLISWCVFLEKYKNTENWHGPSFCKVYAENLSKFTGIPFQDIVDSMLASKLKVAGTIKVGARILKKREKLKNRVQELDDAIKRGRDEFELFLQPIIGELEKARLDLEALEKTIYY